LSVHNISLRSIVCQEAKSWGKDFCAERRKISGYIACDVGSGSSGLAT